MTTFGQLLLPILLSSVAVFFVSAILNTILPWHHKEFPAPPRQDELRAALRQFDLAPGEYALPRPDTMKEMSDPAYIAKLTEGPVVSLTVRPNGPFKMGPPLIKWLCVNLVVASLVAFAAGAVFGPGAGGKPVFHLAALVASAAYAVGLWQGHIWHGRDLVATVKGTIDGVIYGLITAGIFSAMWPG